MFRLRKLSFIGFVMLSLMVSLFVMSKECVAVVSDEDRGRLEGIIHKIEDYNAELEIRGLDDSNLNCFKRPADLNLPLNVDDLTFVFSLFQREENGQPVLRKISVPPQGIDVVGDLHGKLVPAIKQMRNALSNNRHVLFLGDFVDRGAHSLEVSTYLLAKRLLEPARVFVGRGDHETYGIAGAYGTLREIKKKYPILNDSKGGNSLFLKLTQTFNYLPWATVLDFADRRPSIYCAHGGFGPSTILANLYSLNLPINVEEEYDDEFNAIAWSDPDCNAMEYSGNIVRGTGFIYGPPQLNEFCMQNNVGMVIRGHQHENDAQVSLTDSTGRQCLTVMGAPKIKGTIGWTASFCTVKPDGNVEVIDYEDSSIVKYYSVPVDGPVLTAPVLSPIVPVVPAGKPVVTILPPAQRPNHSVSTRSKLYYKYTDSDQIQSIDFKPNDTIKDVQDKLKGVIIGAEIDDSEADFNDVFNVDFPPPTTKLVDFLKNILSYYGNSFEESLTFYLIIEPNTFQISACNNDSVVPRLLNMQKNWTLAEYFKQKGNSDFAQCLKNVNNVQWFLIESLENEAANVINLNPQEDIVYQKIQQHKLDPEKVYLSFTFPDDSLNQNEVQVIDSPPVSTILSDDEAGKTLGEDRFNFKVGVNETPLSLNFDPNSKILDAKNRLADLLSSRNVYGKTIKTADITLLFAGKALKDSFFLGRLRTGTAAITVYISDTSEILLLTARAMRVPVMKESIKGGLPRRSGSRAVVEPIQPISVALVNVAAPGEVLRQGKIRLVQGDITGLRDVGAIVNAANAQLAGGGGVDGVISAAAGPLMRQELNSLPVVEGTNIKCKTGNAVMTTGGNLEPIKIIHTVGPIYKYYSADENARLLASAYRRSLEVAKGNGLRSIAFPCISAGGFGYPAQDAASIAYRTVQEFLQANDVDIDEVIFCCFGDKDADIYRGLLTTVAKDLSMALQQKFDQEYNSTEVKYEPAGGEYSSKYRFRMADDKTVNYERLIAAVKFRISRKQDVDFNTRYLAFIEQKQHFVKQNQYNLVRFITAQTQGINSCPPIETAFQELKNGKKQTHWIWYVFPQIKGLGQSVMCKNYDILNLEEAKQYLLDLNLRSNLQKAIQLALSTKKTAIEVFGSDDVKVKSSLTLFSIAAFKLGNQEMVELIQQALKFFFNDQKDELTLSIIQTG
ncbi:MAG: DUF1810 family protein [Lactobacillales bacterium]|nr:DUF1810 family protein [Lactobacillales bacterium]